MGPYAAPAAGAIQAAAYNESPDTVVSLQALLTDLHTAVNKSAAAPSSARESASLEGGAGVADGQRGELMAAVASDSSAVVVAVVQPTGIAPAQGQSGNVVAAAASAPSAVIDVVAAEPAKCSESIMQVRSITYASGALF